MLATLPDESVEGLLFAFDSLVGVADAAVRPAAARMLQDSAPACPNPTRRERLLRAAADIAAGQPCAVAPPQYDAPVVWPTAPIVEEVQQDDADEDDDTDDDEDPYMEEAPPKLPHLPVRHFFPGLVVRVAQDFCDSYGRAVCAQGLLSVLTFEAVDGGYTVSFLERTVPLRAAVKNHSEILENAGNAWFQPVPSARCLDELAEAIDLRLEEAEEQDEKDQDEKDQDEEDDDDVRLERIGDLRSDVTDCQDWLAREGDRGPVPPCNTGPLAAKVFGRDHTVTAWIRLLFAAMPVCSG